MDELGSACLQLTEKKVWSLLALGTKDSFGF